MRPTPRIVRWLVAAALAGCIAIGFPRAVGAQGYTIPWSNLDGSGTPPPALTGGTFSLSGTAGQPDAGLLSGGAFALQGGFWGVPIQSAVDAGPPTVLVPGRLAPAYPNPFSASTELAFAIAHEAPVRLEVFDLMGQRVRTLVNGTSPAGSYRVHWDGAGEDGQRLPSGMYFIRLNSESTHATQRVVLVQ
jgi:hypothetical protein